VNFLRRLALQEKKLDDSSRCWNRARPWHTFEIVSFLSGLKTYQHPGNNHNLNYWWKYNCNEKQHQNSPGTPLYTFSILLCRNFCVLHTQLSKSTKAGFWHRNSACPEHQIFNLHRRQRAIFNDESNLKWRNWKKKKSLIMTRCFLRKQTVRNRDLICLFSLHDCVCFLQSMIVLSPFL